MFRTLVDGKEQFIPLDRARAQLQKHLAADIRLQQASERQQQLLLAQMATASREEKERRDAEIRAQIQEQRRAYDERLRQIENDNAARERER